MLCPNCKTDLVNINGRYICSDCGKEVPEAEVNVSDWGQSSFGGEKVVSEPGNINVASVNNNPEGPEDYIEGESAKLKPSDPPSNNDSKLEHTSTVIPSTEVLGDTATAEGYYSGKRTSETKDDVDLEQIQKTLSKDKKQETPPDKVPDTVDSHESIDEDLVQSPVEELPASGTALPEDPEIYRDPITEDALNEETVQVKKSDETTKMSMPAQKKTTIVLVSVGLVLAFLLLGGGVYAFLTLTSKANPNLANGGSNVTVKNCDETGVDKVSCINEAFVGCKVAMWDTAYGESTDTSTQTLNYTVRGLVEKRCEIDIKMKEDLETKANVGKSMVCFFDNTSGDVSILQDLSSDNCTGALSDSLFPSVEEDPANTDNTSNVE